MKRFGPLVLTGLIILAFCFSSCRGGRGVGGGGAAPPAPAGRTTSPKIITLHPIVIEGQSRYAPIEGRFSIIASSVDPDEVNSTILEVLEMCESPDIRIVVFQYIDEMREVALDTSIREYMNILEESELYEDNLDEIEYNENGKITAVFLYREEAEVDFYFGDDDNPDDEYPDNPDENFDQFFDDLIEEEEEEEEENDEGLSVRIYTSCQSA